MVRGWMCPVLLSGPGSYLARSQDADAAIALVAEDRRKDGVAIQAGGHIGVWPVKLSRVFATVYTFEPDAANFAALAHNVHAKAHGPVFRAQGVLGDKRGPVALERSTKSTGQHRVTNGPGAVPTYRIDDLALPRLDAVFLDVEGCEIPALRGGWKTIKRFRPVIMAEENKRSVRQGFAIGELAAVLGEIGYRLVDRRGEDLVFAP
jgi:FkbM family methyltransferase